jgi:hypothetical protein
MVYITSMMVTETQGWTPLTDTQSRVYGDARQYFEVYRDAVRRVAAFPGWMFWKRYPSGRHYLVHAYDRTGKGTTLGGPSPENEARLQEFKTQQSEAKLRLKIAKDHLAEHARFCKAARINRMPRHAAAIIRAFDERAPSAQLLVAGTHALYAYEALSDVQFLPALMETKDLDLMWDSSMRRIATAAGKTSEALELTMIEILRTVDGTYTRNQERTFQARNAAGFSVDFLEVSGMVPTKSSDRIEPIAAAGLDALLAETISEIVIDQDGMPLEIRVLDPRLFAAHKRWLSERPDRRPGKRDRDRSQSEAVGEVVRTRKPPLPPLPLLLDNPDAAGLGSILHEMDLAGD